MPQAPSSVSSSKPNFGKYWSAVTSLSVADQSELNELERKLSGEINHLAYLRKTNPSKAMEEMDKSSTTMEELVRRKEVLTCKHEWRFEYECDGKEDVVTCERCKESWHVMCPSIVINFELFNLINIEEDEKAEGSGKKN
jgi:hypothetical protein